MRGVLFMGGYDVDRTSRIERWFRARACMGKNIRLNGETTIPTHITYSSIQDLEEIISQVVDGQISSNLKR